jgi:hypothetical protein
MARIPSSSQFVPVTKTEDVAPAPAVSVGSTADLAPAPPDSGFSDAQAKKVSLSGGYKAVAPPMDPVIKAEFDRSRGVRGQALAVSSLRAGQSDSAGKAETAAPKSAAAFVKWAASQPPQSIGDALAALPLATQGAVVAGVKNGSITEPKVVYAVLHAQPANEQVATMKALPRPALDKLVKFLRGATWAPDQQVNVAVAVEVVARTHWGAKNPSVVAALRAAHDHYQINVFAKNEGQVASVSMAATFGDHHVGYDPTLNQDPEALAAVLAHEGLHLAQGKDAMTGPLGEAQGNAVMMQVWSELRGKGKAERKPLPESARNQFQRLSDAFAAGGERGVRRHVIEAYLKNAQGGVTARQKTDSTAPGDSLKDWEAKRNEFQAALDAIDAEKLPANARH